MFIEFVNASKRMKENNNKKRQNNENMLSCNSTITFVLSSVYIEFE